MSDTVTLSPKYQVVIPKGVRQRAGLKPGQKLVVLMKGKHITLVPLRPFEEMRGILKGVDLGVVREKEDRL